MKIEVPNKDTWPSYALEIERMLDSGCGERKISEYLDNHRWILLAAFGHGEGACFKEYDVEPDERADYLVVAGGSCPDASFIELKSPQDKFFNTNNRKMSPALNEAITKTLNKLFMVNANYEYHYARLGRQLDEVRKGVKRWYQAVHTPELGGSFEIPFTKFVEFQAFIVIGRDGEVERNQRFTEGVSRFLGRIKIKTYDSILRSLRKYDV